MKFLIYGNAPTVGTGYGVQIKHLATHLKRHGHDVGIICTYGHQVGLRDYPTEYGPVRMLPSGWSENALSVFHQHVMQFFGGDPKGGWIIILTDVWALLPLDLSEFNVLAWTPVDHWPAPPEVLKFFHQSGARAIAMSKFGQNELDGAGVPAAYAPLSVDTRVFKPTAAATINGEQVAARELLGIPSTADFVVAMVAMNKDPFDRKNFDGAFRAFGRFWREHQNAVLYVHTDKFGAAGSRINLMELAKHAAIPPHAIFFPEFYALEVGGFSDEMMATVYTAADVLLAPSKGEGFCVPMIEAQACGTPVIVSDFTAQSELVGAGWKVQGQLLFDPAQAASYLQPFTQDIFEALMAAYDADRVAMAEQAIAFAAGYDTAKVFDEYWVPIIDALGPKEPARDKPKFGTIDVIVPLMREANRVRFTKSLAATARDEVGLIIVQDEGEQPVRTYAENVNAGLCQSVADAVLIVGDDCEFLPGWVEAVVDLSDRFDVIGTNDSEPGRVRNPKVANGSHADHFVVRRSYIDDEGASLDGPGVLMPECYRHWYTDVEVIELAKARGVFVPCLDARIVHHHPGYDGDEQARQFDPIYMAAVGAAEDDHRTWMRRAPIVAGHRAA